MAKYKTLLFDLDDTLIDNIESVKYAFKTITNILKIEYSDELFKEWKKADDNYWYRWSTKQMYIPKNIKTIDEEIEYVRANRFIEFFKDLDISMNKAIDLNDIYCKMLGVNIVEIEGAKELLQSLNNDYEIAIATNGPKKAAEDKLIKAKLNPYVSVLVASEEVGFGKPDPKYFEFLYKKCQNKDKDSMLLIGDSLKTDIVGGINNGIDTCWFNKDSIKLPEEYKPTIVINKLLSLKKKL